MGLSTDDPRRPLYAAATWMTAIGIIHLAYGLVMTVSTLWAWPSLAVLIGPSLVVAGIMLLVCASSARRHRAWAVWWGIAITFVLGVAVALTFTMLLAGVGLIDLVRFKNPVGTVTAALLLAFALVHVRILWNLSNAFEGLREPVLTPGRAPGFDPLMPVEPRPVIPIDDPHAPSPGGDSHGDPIPR